MAKPLEKWKTLEKKWKAAAVVGLFLVVAFITGLFSNLTPSPDQPILNDQPLRIHFLDVGQGDSALIELPTGQLMLIDAGTASSGAKIVSYIKALGYEKIDFVVATHPHDDHIGGMPEVFRNFLIGEVWAPKVSHTTLTFERFLDSVEAKGLTIRTAENGKQILSAGPLLINVVSPQVNTTYTDLNDWSAVVSITYGDIVILFTGDAGAAQILAGYNQHVDILKVGHHGSATSTNASLVAALTPTHAIISCGVGNTYGHPTEEALQALESSNVYRTDLQGTIVAESNGIDIIFNVSPVN